MQTDPLNPNGSAPRLSRSEELRFSAPKWYPQQADWVRDPVGSDSVAYNYPLSLRISGPLNRERLCRALEAIVSRHEVLRFVFHAEENNLTQIVMPPRPISLQEIDLQQMESGLRLPKAISMAVEAANRPFEMATEFLLRAVCICLAAEDHILLLVTHHMVCDDWSIAIFLRELSQLYSAFSDARTVATSLPPLPWTYSQFAIDLARRLEGPEMRAQTQFWEKQLRLAGDFHHLAPDNARSSPRVLRSGAHEISILSPSLVAGIKALSGIERVSPFMIFAAALQCLLFRHSAQNDIGLATCVANRNSTRLERLIAPLSNRIVLRTDFSGDASFRELLAQVRNVALSAYSNQDVPFGTIVERVPRGDDSDLNPLFQVLMVMQDAPHESWDFGGSMATWFTLDTGTTRYDLNVWLRFQSDQSLEVDFQYDSNIFGASTVRKLIDDYRSILALFLHDPENRVRSCLAEIQAELRSVVAAGHPVKVPSQPVSEVESRLGQIWQEILGRELPGTSIDLFEAGGTSLLVARLFAEIEKTFGIKLPISTVLEARTCQELARIISRNGSSPKASTVVNVQPFGVGAPVFCIHNHTGDVLFCRNFHKYVDGDHPVYGIQSRALLGERPRFSVEQMAKDYVEEILRIQPHGPCFLLGYSFGGLVAFEMAQLLLSRGRSVAFLGMFNTPAPGSLSGWPLRQFSYLRGRTRSELGKLPPLMSRGGLAQLMKNVANFQRMVLRSAITDAWIFSRKFLGKEYRERIAGALLSLDQINIAAAKAYIPKSVFPGRITFFEAQGMPYLYSIPPKIGWSPFAAEGIEIVDVLNERGRSTDEQFAMTVAHKLNERLGESR